MSEDVSGRISKSHQGEDKCFNGKKELSKAIDLADTGKMQGRPVILIDNEAIENEKKSWLKMV